MDGATVQGKDTYIDANATLQTSNLDFSYTSSSDSSRSANVKSMERTLHTTLDSQDSDNDVSTTTGTSCSFSPSSSCLDAGEQLGLGQSPSPQDFQNSHEGNDDYSSPINDAAESAQASGASMIRIPGNTF